MALPQNTEYQEAIQNPQTCFKDPELRQGQPELDTIGLPRARAGNFADVYKIQALGLGKAWAVKCFTREAPDLQQRYHAIFNHLQQARLPFTVDFQYLVEGIRVKGKWYPILKMSWVEGLTLNEFIKDQLDKPQLLRVLADMWVKLAQQLRKADLAHGDLQHGNVMLVAGQKAGSMSLRLIDYDGMFVPALARSKSGEVGHPNYQHPERLRDGTYNGEVDRFAHLVIHCALRSLSVGGRGLWDRYDNSDNLLFREQDFQKPGTSAVFQELWKVNDSAVHALVGHLLLASQEPLKKVPQLEDLVATGQPADLTAAQEKRVQSLLTAGAGKVRQVPRFVPTPSGSGQGSAGSTAGPTSKPDWLYNVQPPPVTRPANPYLPGVSPPLKTSPPSSLARLNTPVTSPRPSRLLRKAPGSPKSLEDLTPQQYAALVVFCLFCCFPVALFLMFRNKDWQQGKTWGMLGTTVALFLLCGVFASLLPDDKPKSSKAVANKPGPVNQGANRPGPVNQGANAPGPAQFPAQPAAPQQAKKAMTFLTGHTAAVNCVAFLADGRSLVSGGMDGTVRVWDLTSGREIRRVTSTGKRVVAFSPDGRRAVLGPLTVRKGLRGRRAPRGVPGPNANEEVLLWDWDSNRPSTRLVGHKGAVLRAAFSASGNRLLCVDTAKNLYFWDANSGQLLVSWPATAVTWGVALSPDGSRAVTSDAVTVRVWDMVATQELKRFEAPMSTLSSVAFFPNGRQFLRCEETGAVQVWNLDQGKEVGQLLGHGSVVLCLGFSRDGRRLVTGGKDRLVVVWDATTYKELARFPGHQQAVLGVAISPDGRQAVWRSRPSPPSTLPPKKNSPPSWPRHRTPGRRCAGVRFRPWPGWKRWRRWPRSRPRPGIVTTASGARP
jgi:WD40 repeat protein